MPKPAGTIPTWNTGGANQTEPNAAKKILGWTVNEVPPSSYFNWLQNKYGEWISYLNGLEAENLVFTGLVRLARLAGSSDTVPGLDTTDAPTGTYRLLWRIKLNAIPVYARLYSMRNAASVDNFAGGDGLVLVVGAAFDGANWTPDDPTVDVWRLNLCAGDGLSVYHRAAAIGTFNDAAFLAAANYMFELNKSIRDFNVPSGGANPGVQGAGRGAVAGVAGYAGTGAGAVGVYGEGDDVGSAVKGQAGTGASAIGVEGVTGAGVSGVGVKGSAGDANNAAGVQGVASAAGPSAVLANKTAGSGTAEAAVYADSTASSGYAVIAAGDATAPTRAALRLVPQEAPATGQVGDLYVNSGDGKLYICTAAGTPGTWAVVGSQA